MNTINIVMESNYKNNPFEHHAILMAVLGNGYPSHRIWDYEVRGATAHEWFFNRNNND